MLEITVLSYLFFLEPSYSFLLCLTVLRWAPDLPTILYHGTKNERAAMRVEVHRMTKKNKRKGSAKGKAGSPIFITSYEISMNDRPYLQKFGVCSSTISDLTAFSGNILSSMRRTDSRTLIASSFKS